MRRARRWRRRRRGQRSLSPRTLLPQPFRGQRLRLRAHTSLKPPHHTPASDPTLYPHLEPQPLTHPQLSPNPFLYRQEDLNETRAALEETEGEAEELREEAC